MDPTTAESREARIYVALPLTRIVREDVFRRPTKTILYKIDLIENELVEDVKRPRG